MQSWVQGKAEGAACAWTQVSSAWGAGLRKGFGWFGFGAAACLRLPSLDQGTDLSLAHRVDPMLIGSKPDVSELSLSLSFALKAGSMEGFGLAGGRGLGGSRASLLALRGGRCGC